MDISKPRHSVSACGRQQEIENCLLENMRKMPYADINVAAMCRQMGISRNTFYSYFSSKDACLGSICDALTREAVLYGNTVLTDNHDPLSSTIVCLDYLKSQKELWDLIVKNDLLGLFFTQAFEHFYSEEQTLLGFLDTPELKSDPQLANCYVSCLLTLVLQWHREGFQTPTEEMARKYLRILYKPMIYPRCE